MQLTSDQRADIDQQRALQHTTRRVTVPALEALLYEPIPVLDHGFLRVIDYMGDDSSVVQAARVSYGRGTKKTSEDAGLINYLMRHAHTTPFEMAEIKFHVKLPIFVARQWIRHRMSSTNEYSARYSILDKEFYIPEPQQLAAQSTQNHQGRGAVLEGNEAAMVLDILREDAVAAYDGYETLLNERADGTRIDVSRQGLARELARMNLTLNYYTQWYWKVDLHNLLRFLKLRADSHAQYEIRVYAEAMLKVVQAWVPLSHAAFEEHLLGATTLSRTGMAVIRRLLAGEAVTQETSGLGKREWTELMKALEAP